MSILPQNDIVTGIGDPGPENAKTAADDRGYNLPNSKKVYVASEIHPDIRVPFREIDLAPTKTMSGEIEVNEPVRVYDTSGPWSDPDFRGSVEEGLPLLRAKWIRDRGDVEEIAGRIVQPIDDGYLSEKHRTSNAERRTSNSNGQTEKPSAIRHPQSAIARKPLRAESHSVTQLWYARQGIITPEMEFIAIRENGRGIENRESRIGQNDSRFTNHESRDLLAYQHPGESFGANIPREITPELISW